MIFYIDKVDKHIPLYFKKVYFKFNTTFNLKSTFEAIEPLQ